MKYLLISVLISLGVTPFSKASIFGEENITLGKILVTTIKELNELEKLVSNAEKYTKKITEYNELVQDHLFKAQRIKLLAKEMTEKRQIKNLSDVNHNIREIDSTIENIQGLMNEYNKNIFRVEDIKKAQALTSNSQALREKLARHQIQKASSARSLKKVNQITSQNTGLMFETQLQMKKNQDQMLVELARHNKLKSEELLRARRVDLLRKNLYTGGE